MKIADSFTICIHILFRAMGTPKQGALMVVLALGFLLALPLYSLQDKGAHDVLIGYRHFCGSKQCSSGLVKVASQRP